MGQPGAQGRIGYRHPDHVSGDVPGASQQGKRKGTGQLPQDHHKGNQGAQCLDNAHKKAQGLGDEQVHILTDPLVRVVHLLPEHFQPVIGLMLEPPVDVPVGEPAPPVQHQHLLEIVGIDRQDNVEESQHRKPLQLVEDLFCLVILESRIERIVPLVQQHQHGHHCQCQQQDGHQ